MATTNPKIDYDGFDHSKDALMTKEVVCTSTADGSQQAFRVFLAPGSAPRPLLVMLHTWSADYQQRVSIEVESWCVQKNWHFVVPNFRGPSWNPGSCASDLAIQDVLDAIAYVRQQAAVLPSQVFLMGLSGGGHFSLILAARHPELWAGVTAWVPIYDLTQWHAESEIRRNNYDRHIEMACGGRPGSSADVDAQLRYRSPSNWLRPGLDCILDINAGIHDGHTGSVPVSHSLQAFNAAALSPADHIAAEDIAVMTQERRIPSHLQGTWPDPAFADHPILFRRTSGKVRVTLFEGGHQGLPKPIIAFLEQHSR